MFAMFHSISFRSRLMDFVIFLYISVVPQWSLAVSQLIFYVFSINFAFVAAVVFPVHSSAMAAWERLAENVLSTELLHEAMLSVPPLSQNCSQNKFMKRDTGTVP